MSQLNLNQLMDFALRAHSQGRLEQAERLYRHVLADAPNHAPALHLLGVVAHQRGYSEDAARIISMAIARDPNVAAYHSNLGLALRAIGQVTAAVDAFRNAGEDKGSAKIRGRES